MICVPQLPVNKNYRSIAVLTSGGDAPGMNAAIRAVTRYALAHGLEVFGIKKGYSGLLEGQMEKLTPSSVANIIQRGGTILKTDRCLSFHKKSTRKEAGNLLKRKGIDALIVIGGDGSFTGAHLLENETGIPTIGIPGTIDNDIPGTEDTIGFDTALNTAIDAIDRIRDTASSHDRIFIVEVMGKSSGFIASEVGLGGGAETIVVPEKKTTVAEVYRAIERGIRRGKTSSIIVMAEGETPGLCTKLADAIEKRGYPTKVCILGHTQRGGKPTAHDRVLASVLGASSVAYLLSGSSNAMVGVQKNEVKLVPFNEVIGTSKNLPLDHLHLAQTLAI